MSDQGSIIGENGVDDTPKTSYPFQEVIQGKIEVLESNVNSNTAQYNVALDGLSEVNAKLNSDNIGAEERNALMQQKTEYTNTINNYEASRDVLAEMEGKLSSGKEFTREDAARIENASSTSVVKGAQEAAPTNPFQETMQGKVEVLKANVESSAAQYHEAVGRMGEVDAKLNSGDITPKEKDALMLQKIEYTNTINNYEASRDVLAEMEGKLSSGKEFTRADADKIEDATMAPAIRNTKETSNAESQTRFNKDDFIVVHDEDGTIVIDKQKTDPFQQAMQGRLDVLKANVESSMAQYEEAKQGIENIDAQLGNSALSQDEKDALMQQKIEYTNAIKNYESSRDVLAEMEGKLSSGKEFTRADADKIEDATMAPAIRNTKETSNAESQTRFNKDDFIVVHDEDGTIVIDKQKTDPFQQAMQGRLDVLKANVESSMAQYEEAKQGIENIDAQLGNSALSQDEKDELLLQKIKYENAVKNYENNASILSEMENKLLNGTKFTDSDLNKIEGATSTSGISSLKDYTVTDNSVSNDVTLGKIEVLKANIEAGTDAYYRAKSEIDDINSRLGNPKLTEEERENLLLQKIRYQNTIDNYDHNMHMLESLEERIAKEGLEESSEEINLMINDFSPVSTSIFNDSNFDLNSYLDDYYELLLDSGYDKKSYELLSSMNSAISLFDSIFDGKMGSMLGSAFNANKLVYEYVLESEKDIYTYVMNSLTPAMSEVQKLAIILEGRAELQKRLEKAETDLANHLVSKPARVYETYTGNDGKEHKRKTGAFKTWENDRTNIEEEIDEINRQLEDINEEARIILLKIEESDSQVIDFGTYAF